MQPAAATPQLDDLYPLSPMQEGLLFHSLADPSSGVHLAQHTFVLQHLDIDAFIAAWQAVTDCHRQLRTAFVWRRTGRPLQAVLRSVIVPVARADWRGLDPAERRARLQAHLAADRAAGFTLNRAPLFRLFLAALDGEAYQLVLTQHHALLDGWSLPLLLGDLTGAYRAICAGKPPHVTPRPPFREYIAWLSRQDATDVGWWRTQLANYRGLAPAAQSPSTCSSPLRHQVTFAAPLEDALRQWSRQHRLTLNTAIQGAWALVLGHLHGTTDVVFGSVVSGRPVTLPRAEEMLGLFINTVPVRARCDADRALAAWLQDLQRQHAEAADRAYTPFAAIREASELPVERPLFDTIVNFRNYPRPEAAGETTWESPADGEASYDSPNTYACTLNVEASPHLSIDLHLVPARFPFMPSRLRQLLERALTTFVSPGQPTVADARASLAAEAADAMSARRAAFRAFTAMAR